MNVHEKMESTADLLIAGGLSPEERQEAEQHAASCAACGSILRDARDFAAWAKGLIASDAPPADLEDRVIERFRAAGSSKKRRFIVGKRVLKVTGSIAAAVGLIFLGNMFSPQSGANAAGLPGLAAAQTDFDEQGRNHWNFFGDRGVDVVSDGLALEVRRAGTSLDGDGRARRLSRAEQLNDALSPSFALTVETLKAQNGREDRGEAVMEDLAKLEDKHVEYARERKKVEETVEKKHKVLAANASRSQLGMEAERLAEGGDEFRTYWAKMDGASDAKPSSKQGGALKASTLSTTGFAGEVVLSPPALQDNRKIIRTADVALEVDSYDATYTKLSEIAAAEKGHVASANTQKMANGKIQATVILRIPPERFEAVLARFKDLGTVRHQNVGSDDVTKAYIDLESRLASKQILAGRLSKLLAEGKGNVKELMEVEVQMGATNEAIEQIKGEIKYYDNRIGLSTLTLSLAEKDLGQPFEYVQTLQANLALTVRDPNDAYAKAQKEIVDAGGQVVDSRMTRQNDGSSTGTIRGRVDADKFQGLRDTLKKLGVATNDTVNLQKSARGGREGTPKVDAPLRKEQAVLELTLSSPPIFVTRRSQLLVETSEVENAYATSRKAVEAAGGKIVDGSLNGRTDRMAAVLRIQIDADKFAALVDVLKAAGKVKNAVVNSVLPTTAADGGTALLRERAEIELSLISPPQLIADENGLGKSIRDTFANSWAGFLWSIEKLFVGISLAGPWLLVVLAGILFWRRARTKKTATPLVRE